MIKKYLKKHIKDNVLDEEVGLLLSGGLDSISVGISAELVGKKVNAYSFYLEGIPSYDFAMAANIASQRGWNFVPVVVPRTNLVDDWYKLVDLGCRKKTHFECVFPFLYVYPMIKEKYVLTGWGADGYFGPGKKAMMRYSSYKKKRNYVKYCQDFYPTKKIAREKRLNWNEFRLDYLDGDCAGYKEHTTLTEKHNKIHIAPYKDSKDIRKLLMSKSWSELNKPRQKEIVRKDFTILEKYGSIKPHINLHLGSGVDKLFETLLENKKINYNDRKRMMDVCKDHYSPLSEFSA